MSGIITAGIVISVCVLMQDYEEKQAEQRIKRKLVKKDDETGKRSPRRSRSRSPVTRKSGPARSPKRKRSRSPRLVGHNNIIGTGSESARTIIFMYEGLLL